MERPAETRALCRPPTHSPRMERAKLGHKQSQIVMRERKAEERGALRGRHEGSGELVEGHSSMPTNRSEHGERARLLCSAFP